VLLDTPPPKSGTFSVPHVGFSHGSLKGPPAPEHVPGRIFVAVQHQSTEGTDKGAHTHALLDAYPTAATLLAGVPRRGGHHMLPDARRLGGKEGAELAPAGIPDALGQGVVAYQVGDPQVF